MQNERSGQGIRLNFDVFAQKNSTSMVFLHESGVKKSYFLSEW